MPRPLPAYEGDQPYVFVSYSHDDDRQVFRELGWLQQNGINLWYDDGIYAGEDWRDAIGNAVSHSALCLYFVSRRSVQSDHCIREVKYALDNEIQVLPVYLEPAELPSGLAMALSNVQAVLKYSLQPAKYESQTIRALRSAVNNGEETILPHSSRRRPVIAAIAVITVIAALVFTGWPPWPSEQENNRSIAVMPFAYTGDGSLDITSEALARSVTSALVSAGNIPVVSLDSSRRLASEPDSEIARRLGVSHLVRGDVQTTGRQLTISTRLISLDSSTTQWSRTFEGSADNLLELQDEVSASVIEAFSRYLELPLRDKSVRSGPTNPVAYSLYLEALNLDSRFPGENRKAIKMLEQAVELEPEFVSARVELAFAFWRTNTMPSINKEKIKSLLRTALDQQPDHGAAMALMGTIVARCDYDWAEGFRMLQTAHEAHPFDARVQALWAHHLGSIHHPEAPQASLVAYQLDPLSGPAAEDYARSLLVLGRQIDALEIRQNYLAMTRNDADLLTAEMLIGIGALDEARQQLELLKTTMGSSYPDILYLEMLLALRERNFSLAMEIESELMGRRENEYVRFEMGSPRTFTARYRQAIAQRSPQVIFSLLGNKPLAMSDSEWEELRAAVKAGEISTPVVANYRARSDGEIEDLLAAEVPVPAELLSSVAGVYHSEAFPALSFEVEEGRLFLTRPDNSFRLALAHTAQGTFEMTHMKGYRYEFGEGILTAFDGQIRREYIKK